MTGLFECDRREARTIDDDERTGCEETRLTRYRLRRGEGQIIVVVVIVVQRMKPSGLGGRDRIGTCAHLRLAVFVVRATVEQSTVIQRADLALVGIFVEPTFFVDVELSFVLATTLRLMKVLNRQQVTVVQP